MSMEPHEIQRMNALMQKLDLVERKVDFLFRHLNVGFRDERPPPNEIEAHVLKGDRMGAIKVFQQQHGVGLAEAKRAIEELAARLGV